MTDDSRAVDEQVQSLLTAVRSDNAENVAAAFDRLSELLGTATGATISTALEGNGLTEAALATLTKSAHDVPTEITWIRVAVAAVAVGRLALAIEAAESALRIDPASIIATLMLSVAANRLGDHDIALRFIMDLFERVPAAKEDPSFIIQAALAKMGCKEAKAALETLDTAWPSLVTAGFGFDAYAVRAQVLEAIPERSTEAPAAWEHALAIALHPAQAIYARRELLATLWRAKRYDDCLRLIDQALAATTDPKERFGWLEARMTPLEAKGDIDGARAAWEDLLALTTDRDRRSQLRMDQARAALGASRPKEAAACFDRALAEIPPDVPEASDRRLGIRLEKAIALAQRDIDTVLADLDELDAGWRAPGWPLPIDLRIGGLLAAGRADEAFVWLEQRLSRTPALADHPAAHLLRGEVEIKLGYTEEAMQCYARAVVAAPAFGDLRAWGARLASAVPTQQWKVATNAYDQIGQLDPNSALRPDVRVIAAMAYVRLSEFERGLELTEEPHPSDSRMRMLRDQTRAEAQLRLEKYDDALATTDETLKRYQVAQPGEVPAEVLVAFYALRAQVFNARKEFALARDAGTAAIDVPDDPGIAFQGLTAFVRIGALMQRSLALYQLKKKTEAHRDIDEAIAGFVRLRNSAILKIMEGASDFDRFETSLWYAKGTILHAENRNEEALAAYTRAEQLERHGNMAGVAQGYALVRTGDFEKALEAFERALIRASSPNERADALDGKGRALVRLGRFDEAIVTLHAGLDARVMEPDNDPGVFELLGIAYDALKRTGAAARAFRRAWRLTKEGDRSANLARGVTAAELGLANPAAALAFLEEELPSRLKDDRTLLFNRALALDGLGRRPAAIGYFVKARDKGLDRAQDELDRRDAPAGLGRWTHYWFGPQARQNRRAGGLVLLIIAATGVAAPLFQWLLLGKFDWYLLLLPSVVALVLLALPNIKSISGKVAGVEFTAEPMSATGRDAAAVTAPESFTVPPLVAVTIARAESRPAAI